MFSLENFYKIIHENLIQPFNGVSAYFSKFGSIDPKDIKSYTNSKSVSYPITVVFNDQEPLYLDTFQKILNDPNNMYMILAQNVYDLSKYFSPTVSIIATSEISEHRDYLIRFSVRASQSWYYFYHGFAALDWYRNIQYYPPTRKFTKVFITFNNLFTEKRSYRLNLIARLLDAGLRNYGHISLNNVDTKNKIKQEIFSTNSLLSTDSKKIILQNLFYNASELIIDHDFTQGSLSADDNLDTLSLGLFHLVTETIYYDKKLHLTEKIFKPIVARRPFFLVAAPGNLAYLKSYGFRTFDRWIDESYDTETDPDQRIIKIVNEVDRLCKLNPTDLDAMYQEMQETLDYNFDWFYGGFKQLIVDELVDNFHAILKQHNNGQWYVNQLDLSLIDFDEVKKRLAQ